MPTEQQDLFGVRQGPVPGVLRYDVPSQPRHTSEAAAERIKPKAATIRQQVLGFLRGRGPEGATDREIFQAVRMFYPEILEGTVRARRVELTRDDGNPDGPVEAGTMRRNGMTVWVVRNQTGEQKT